MWYRRHECGLRMSIFFSMATAAGAFGGLLARGISEMDGVGGKGGWAWIFILEGIITFVVALWAFWAFNDYPDTAKFITESERKEIYRRLNEDRGALADEFDTKYVWQAFKDWKIYAHCFNFLGQGFQSLDTTSTNTDSGRSPRCIPSLFSSQQSSKTLATRITPPNS